MQSINSKQYRALLGLHDNPFKSYNAMNKTLKTLIPAIFISLASLISSSALAQECSDKYFSCKVAGKVVNLCGSLSDSGEFYFMSLKIGKENIEIEDKLTFAEYSAGKATLESIYFKAAGNTYAITVCSGMECNPDKSSWLSILKGSKKSKGSGICDAGTGESFENLPITFDKKNNRVIDKKHMLGDRFLINKKPKDSFLTENIGWSN
jgi:hypothetical protein